MEDSSRLPAWGADLKLLALGVNPSEEALYVHLLQGGWTGLADASDVLGMSVEELSGLLSRLESQGMIRISREGDVAAVDPVSAIEQLIEERIGELNAELRRVADTRAELAYFEGRWRQGLSGQELSGQGFVGIERIENTQDVRNRLDELSFFSYQEVLAIHPGSGLRAETLEAAKPLDVRCLRRGTRMRSIFHESALSSPHTLAYLKEISSLGAEIRVSTEPLERVLIYDRKVAVVPSDPNDTSRGALVIREQGLLSQIHGLFVRVWDAADDLAVRGETRDDTSITPLEREVLSALATVDKDELGARRMGVAVRTYRGYVAALMAKLDATSRFQVALIAKERGWM
ncbi:helix-turn-helix transcriptional regulator [Streptomyces sp. NPDC019224]|uniref:helix-turn-helix transcriptional regulator n=1 Tax=Streptomyces sp. NPDC019224 TaxID=3154484 RepID=UPI0033EE635F